MGNLSVKKRIGTGMLAAVLAFAMTAAAPASSEAASKYVKSLSVSKSAVTVSVGKSTSVNATVKVSGKASKAVRATSANKAIATVSVGKASSKGVTKLTVKGVKAGKTTITVKTAAKNKKKKVISKKVSVTVKANSNTGGYSISQSTATLAPGASLQLSVMKGSAEATGISPYWESSNYSVCNVSSSSGLVVAKAVGTATITASFGDYEVSCKVTVKEAGDITSDFDYDRDVTVEYGKKNVYIEFEINKEEITEEELREMGYDVSGGTASKDVECVTATYTFSKLPTTLGDIKTFDLTGDHGFGPMAASICALTTWEDMSTQNDGMYKNPIWDYFEYLNGPKSVISNAEKSGRYASMQATLNKGKYCYFDGASNTNNYTPNQPYSFTLYEGPYYIPAKSSTIAHPEGEPERYMILISFGGDDAERYIDVYKSGDGNWYSYEDQWAHLIAGIKDVGTAW